MTELIKFERTFRRSGGTLAITIPPEIQKAIGLRAGQLAELCLTEDRKILVAPKK